MTNKVTFKVVVDNKEAKKSIKSLQSQLQKTGKTMTSVGKKAAIGFGILSGAIIGLTKVYANLETGLTNVATLLNPKEYQKFSGVIKKDVTAAIQDMGFGIKDSTKAMFDTVSALGVGEQASRTFAAAQKLAVGGVTALSTSTDGLTSIMNAYGKETTDANEVAMAFFTAQKFGKTTVAELAQNVGRLAPTAKRAGIGFKEMLAFMSQLTLQGLSTEESTVALRQAMASLLDPTKEAAEVLKRYQVPIGATELRTKGFRFALQQLAVAAKKNPDAIGKMIPNIRAVTAVASLGEKELSNYDKILNEINIDSKKTADGQDSLSLAFKKQQQTVNRAFAKMSGSLTILASTFGEILAPSIIKVADGIASFSKKLSEASPFSKKLVLNLAILTTTILGGVAALGLFGGAVLNGISFIIKMVKVLRLAEVATFLLNTAFLTNPIVLIIGGIIVAAGLLYLAFKTNFLNIQNKLEELSKVFKQSIEFIKILFEKINFSDLFGRIKDFYEKFADLTDQFFTFFSDTFEDMKKAAINHITPIFNFFKSIFNAIWTAISNTLTAIKDRFIKVFGFIAGPLGLLKDKAKENFDEIKDKAEEISGKIESVWDQAGQQITQKQDEESAKRKEIDRKEFDAKNIKLEESKDKFVKVEQDKTIIQQFEGDKRNVLSSSEFDKRLKSLDEYLQTKGQLSDDFNQLEIDRLNTLLETEKLTAEQREQINMRVHNAQIKQQAEQIRLYKGLRDTFTSDVAKQIVDGNLDIKKSFNDLAKTIEETLIKKVLNSLIDTIATIILDFGAAAIAGKSLGDINLSGIGKIDVVKAVTEGGESIIKKGSDVVGSVVSGATTGAAIGSVIPIVGTAVGAVVGGVVGGITEAVGGVVDAIGDFFGFQKGTSFVKESGIAAFDQGEIVVSRPFAEGIRKGDLTLSGNKTNNNFNRETIINNTFDFSGANFNGTMDEVAEAVEMRFVEKANTIGSKIQIKED